MIIQTGQCLRKLTTHSDRFKILDRFDGEMVRGIRSTKRGWLDKCQYNVVWGVMSSFFRVIHFSSGSTLTT